MTVKIAPSILCADFSRMGSEIERMERAGADLIHCDVMDGSFVAPITFGGQMIRAIRSRTRLALDCHLMVEHPQTQIESFAKAGADIITVHYGACNKLGKDYLKDTLLQIRALGAKCGAVINPNEPIEEIYGLFPLCDMVVIMGVYPGYSGQKFLPEVLEKVKKARQYAVAIGRPDMDIESDGGVNIANAGAIRAAGANVLVAGSAVFGAEDAAAAIEALKR